MIKAIFLILNILLLFTSCYKPSVSPEQRYDVSFEKQYEQIMAENFRPYRFDEVDVPAEMIDPVIPKFPGSYNHVELVKRVLIMAFVDEKGDVTDAFVLKSCGIKAFDISARKAAYKCRYKPAIKDGQPIGVWVTYEVEFSLTEIN